MGHTFAHEEEIAFVKMEGHAVHHKLDIALNGINHYFDWSDMAFQFLSGLESKQYDTAVIVADYMLKCNFCVVTDYLGCERKNLTEFEICVQHIDIYFWGFL